MYGVRVLTSEAGARTYQEVPATIVLAEKYPSCLPSAHTILYLPPSAFRLSSRARTLFGDFFPLACLLFLSALDLVAYSSLSIVSCLIVAFLRGFVLTLVCSLPCILRSTFQKTPRLAPDVIADKSIDTGI
jgi:hypothetical protein